MISFAILVADEESEFRTLITNLVRIKSDEDEIVVLIDSDKATAGIMQTIDTNISHIKYYKRSLNNDFASQKNYLFSKCTKDYIINLDADEIIYEDFINNVKEIIEEVNTPAEEISVSVEEIVTPTVNLTTQSVSDVNKDKKSVISLNGIRRVQGLDKWQ